nr:histidine kinase dimerization/phosphoacceptor domain -containing protein [Roseococcus pinisoli]
MRVTWDEAERVEALHNYGVLDSDLDFDGIVKIASHICRTPIAVVNFVDATRQWFGAECGLGVRETPLDVSICAHAILQPDIFVIPDLAKDPRFGCNPLVAGDPNLRFYGGALLTSSNGLPLGTVCVLDYQPRPMGLTDEEEDTLRALARQVMNQLELRLAIREKEALVREKELLVAEAHHRVSNSLQMVQSLLTLQSRQTIDPEASQQLQASAQRVNTFGLMHEHLYRSGAGIEVDLAVYLATLIEDQNKALASTLGHRRIALHAEAIQWPTSEVATVGLIVFELATNALKYGEGLVTVRVSKVEGLLFIVVEDEGAGIPISFEPEESRGLGMRLIRGLVSTRGGQVAVDRSKRHTAFVVTMEMPEAR